MRTLLTPLCAASLVLALTAPGASGQLCDSDFCIYTSVSYAAAGATVLMEDPSLDAGVLASDLAFLSLGSTQMHRTRDWGGWPSWESMDHAGMHATYAALAVHAWGAPWWAMLGTSIAAPALFEAKWDVDEKSSMGVYMAATALSGVKHRDWKQLLEGFALMGAGLAVRQDGDVGHGFWHLLTAAGTGVLYQVGPAR